MEEIIINPKFKRLIRPLSLEEYQGLEESIIKEGCRDALVLWNSTIVDGHNRYEICKKHNIEFKTIQKDFQNEDFAKLWIIDNQLSRRNLNDYYRGALALEYESTFKKIAKDNQKHSNGRGKKGKPILAGVKGEVRDMLAKMAGISHGNIDKIKKIQAKASEQTKMLLEAGELSINQAYKELDKPAQAYNGGEFEWYTPSDIIEAARKTMGSIDFDPASTEQANKTVKATVYHTKETNGLDKAWSGNIWLNPPYVQPLIQNFSDKLISELPNINQALVLVNNATETAWCQNLISNCNVCCFIKGRVKFIDANGKPGAPLQGQVVLYFGKDEKNFKEYFSKYGLILSSAGWDLLQE